MEQPRKVDVRLPGKGNSNYHGARPVHPIITMIKWIRTIRLSIKNSLSAGADGWAQVHSPQSGRVRFVFRVSCLGLGFRVQGLGFRVQGLGSRIGGFWFRVSDPTPLDHPTPFTLHPTPFTLHPTPRTLGLGFRA